MSVIDHGGRKLARLTGCFLLAALLGGARAAAAQVVISGTVSDVTGTPIAFASITIESLRLATASDVNGYYRLVVPEDRIIDEPVTLRVGQLSYRSETREVMLDAAEITLDFELALDPLKLEAVVATGATLESGRERLGFTVSTVEGELLVESRETNVVAALAGKAPGVWVTKSTGDPAGGTFINIRGFNTLLGSNQPLFVIDGTPVSNNSDVVGSGLAGPATQNRMADLNPNDIESIEILKGPAASSIYGAEGANGVVLVTTKAGRRGLTQVTVKGSYSWDEVNRSVPLQTQYGRGVDGAPFGQPGVNLAPLHVVSWGPELECQPDCVLGQDVFDHSGEMFGTGHRATIDASVQGGGDRSSFFFSAGFTDHRGAIRGNDRLDRLNLRLKASHFLRDNLSVGGNFAYTDQRGELVAQGNTVSGMLLGAFRTPPEFNNLPYLDPETGLHRSYRSPNPTEVDDSRGFDNPHWVANEITNDTDVSRIFGNLRLDWGITDALDFSWTLGGDFYSDQQLAVIPRSSSTVLDAVGFVDRATFSEKDFENTFLLTGRHDFSPSVASSLSLGWSMRQQKYSRFRTSGLDLVYGAEQLGFAIDYFPDEYRSEIRTERLFADLNLDLFGQLFVSGRLTNEASSTFGPDTDDRFWYPSLSLAWSFNRLSALRSWQWLSFGKLRLAYGEAGKAPLPYSNVTAYDFFSYLSRGGLTSQSVLGDTAIAPEKTREIEVGLELALLDSRISGSLVYYDQKTSDAILNVPAAPSTGRIAAAGNGAEFENVGWEATLDLLLIQGRNFQWELGGIWSTNRSRVLDLLGAESVGLGGFYTANNRVVLDRCGTSATEPCAFGVIWGSDFIRFGREGGTVVDGVNIDEAYPNATPGALYIAEDGFPVQDPQERVIGDPNPDWLGSIRTTFRIYDNLRLTGFLDIKKGGDTYDGTKGALTYYGTHTESLPYHGAGTPHVFEGFGPGAGQEVVLDWLTWGFVGPGNSFNGPGAQFVEDSGYVKLRELSLTYVFNQPWLARLGLSTIELTLSGVNLKTWTDYSGIDPETNLRGQSLARGLDYFNHPQLRSWVVTVNVIR